MSDTIIQMNEALKTMNPYDLYDALADNNLETDEVWQNGKNVEWLANHIRGLLLKLNP
jgi:hypothetical protein